MASKNTKNKSSRSRTKSNRKPSGNKLQRFFAKKNARIAFIAVFAAVGVYVAYIAFAAIPVYRSNPEYWLPRIRGCESGSGPSSPGNYSAQNPVSSASGAYQFLDGTWANYKGYSKARYAPPPVQDERANIEFDRNGTRPWNASYNCWKGDPGSGGAPIGAGEAPCSHPTISRSNTGGGDCVRHLQQHLNSHGADLRVDGAWGPATDSAVRSFQRSQGFGGRGIVGPSTWERLHGSPGAPAPPPPPISTSPLRPNPESGPSLTAAYYKLQFVHNNLCVDFAGNQNTNGGTVQQWSCNGQANQEFEVLSREQGYYKIRSRWGGRRCLDAKSSSNNNGETVQQWSCISGAGNQLVGVLAREQGGYKIRFSHNNQCLDADSSQNRVGGKIQQWNCISGQANQLVRLLPVGSSSSPPPTSSNPPPTTNKPPSNAPPSNQPQSTGSDRISNGQTLGTNQSISSQNGQYVLRMQSDGNLVVYASGNRAIWSSRTSGSGARLVMQGDGNLVIYRGSTPLWASGTNGRGASFAVMQNDGNFVVYTNSGQPTWSSK